jgi:hypothetical protein
LGEVKRPGVYKGVQGIHGLAAGGRVLREGKVFEKRMVQGSVLGFEILPPRKAPDPKIRLEHCILNVVGVRYRSVGKSKRKSPEKS